MSEKAGTDMMADFGRVYEVRRKEGCLDGDGVLGGEKKGRKQK